MPDTAEHQRLRALREGQADWQTWGPYLSERAWGTIREDYSADGNAWAYFPHDHARSRVYRWNEDGLAGISDRNQFLCFGLALWNGRDPILKERLFGLTGPEGNHGEDVKEYSFYQDNVPTHSYMRLLYKYPQGAFPYDELVHENGRRGYDDPEYELLHTGIFDEDRYFDVSVEYAKAAPNDMLIRLIITNRGPEEAYCAVLPTLWFRNTWSWGYNDGPRGDVIGKPGLREIAATVIEAEHSYLGTYRLYLDQVDELLFTENETNVARLYGLENPIPFVKDAFHRYVIDKDSEAVNPAKAGTKAAGLYNLNVPAGNSVTLRLRLSAEEIGDPFEKFDETVATRREEADAFYAAVQNPALDDDKRNIQRQALAGMLWGKQLYYYDVRQWLIGDPAQPEPPEARKHGRNQGWEHLNNFDILSVPDKWEYPWYAAWDLAFHCVPLAMIDPDFAKKQLLHLTRIWYMHPNGQIPAYEWGFDDVNPPVHAWAVWHVYDMDAKSTGTADRDFLERAFHKMLLNFTWWVNREDEEGLNVFQGGFLGLDNISVFDRGAMLPTGGHIDQSDGTAWMGFYCLCMLRIALELALKNPVYEDMATKFYEHFLGIASAMTNRGGKGFALWDGEDGFFYDVLHLPDRTLVPLRLRSLVGLMPLLAVDLLEPFILERMPDFSKRLEWFTRNRPELSGNMTSVMVPGVGERLIMAIPTRERLLSILRYLFDEAEFYSPFGVRSLSKVHEQNPYSVSVNGEVFSVDYQPAESHSGLFGGNSNWRGPVWFPINYLLIESLLKYHRYYGDDLTVECPTGSGNWLTLDKAAEHLAQRLIAIFTRDSDGRRPVYGGIEPLQDDPHWNDNILFHEYFHGDNGAGLGASHQTGWTGLVAVLLQHYGGPTKPTP